MTQEKIDRINALYRKSKAEGLTEEEKKEQDLLRKEFVASVKSNLRSQLNNIDMVNEDGSVENLGAKERTACRSVTDCANSHGMQRRMRFWSIPRYKVKQIWIYFVKRHGRMRKSYIFQRYLVKRWISFVYRMQVS